jgi:curved DNA-binding protein CbpA
VLGLPFGADPPEVKSAYRRLVRAYHPDLHPDATHDERRSLAARFAEVTAAYRALVA